MLDLNNLISFYGEENQHRVAMEECAELIQAINKCLRYPGNSQARVHLVEEIGDTLIMIKQLLIIYHIDLDELYGEVHKKIDIIEQRMNEEKDDNLV